MSADENGYVGSTSVTAFVRVYVCVCVEGRYKSVGYAQTLSPPEGGRGAWVGALIGDQFVRLALCWLVQNITSKSTCPSSCCSASGFSDIICGVVCFGCGVGLGGPRANGDRNRRERADRAERTRNER